MPVFAVEVTQGAVIVSMATAVDLALAPTDVAPAEALAAVFLPQLVLLLQKIMNIDLLSKNCFSDFLLIIALIGY